MGRSLRCLFRWSRTEGARPEGADDDRSPEEMADRLVAIARKKGYRQVRIGGNEPTRRRDHLLGVLERIPPDRRCIRETNGILLGYDPTYAEDLARVPNLYVRVSVKGSNEEDFGRLTGARPGAFDFQIRAVENLLGPAGRCSPR